MSSIKRDVKKKVLPRPEARCFLEIQPTVSSIKRDVKKKVLPRPEARCFLEIQPTVIKLPWGSLTCAHSDQFPLVS
jgi:hypothetical protein